MFSPQGSIVLKALIQALSLFFRLLLSFTYTLLSGLGHRRGCGIFAESVCTGEFGPNWVVFC